MSAQGRQEIITARYAYGTYIASVVGNSKIRASATSGELNAVVSCARKLFGHSSFETRLLDPLCWGMDARYQVKEIPPGGKSTQETP